MQHILPGAALRRTGRTLAGTLARFIAITALLTLATATLAQNDDMITVSYKDADIRTIIEAVAEVTGKNFIVDARVKAQVTLISNAAMTPEAFYETFLSILQVYGYVAVPSGDVIKILPDTNARQLPGNDLPQRIANGSDSIVTQVIEVQNVGAAQLVPILRPLIPQYGHLAAHPASNMLIISDRAANVQRMIRIIRRIDQSGDEEIEVIPLEHATAAEMVRILSTLTQAAARGDASASPTALVADERTNSVLVGGDKASRLRLRTLIAHLDSPLEEGGNTQVIYLNYANAEDLATRLREQLQQGGQGAAQAAANASNNVTMWADPDTNALVVTAPPKIMRNLKMVIDKLDIRRHQVLVEAILVDLTIDRSAELGINWIFDSTQDTASAGIIELGGNIAAIAGAAAGDAPEAALSAIADGTTVGIGRITDNGTSFAALIRALAGDASTNILSTPSIVTMDNEEAEISVGQQVPFLTGSFSNTGGNVGAVNPFQTINREDVGLKLIITPQINEGDAVILDVQLEVSSISQGSTGAVDLITNQRTVRQKVVLQDGDIIVLGGLIDENLLESESRVPFLGSIPGLGALFRSRTTSKVKRNLMVFIRPKILRDGNQATYETNQKYNYIRNLQMGAGGPIPLMRGEERPIMPELTEPLSPTHIGPDTDAEKAGEGR